MKFRNLALIGAAALFASPVFATTYFGGLEDWSALDYDYNDVVFSMSGSNLKINSSAQWFNAPVLGTNAVPFWNHSSLDGSNDNIGYCIYGGGTCNGGVALDPAAKYLAANQTSTGSANDVSFSSTGAVQLKILVQNTKAQDTLGWYLLSDPGSIMWLNPSHGNGVFSFNPTGAFGLVMQSHMGGNGYVYFSQGGLGTPDSLSHFAFFDPPTATPEPAALGTLGLGLLGIASLVLRRKASRLQN